MYLSGYVLVGKNVPSGKVPPGKKLVVAIYQGPNVRYVISAGFVVENELKSLSLKTLVFLASKLELIAHIMLIYQECLFHARP